MEDSTTQTAVPTQTAEKFIQDVRRKTRRKFTAEEKIRIVLEGMKRELTVTELCRREGMPTAGVLQLGEGLHGSRQGALQTRRVARREQGRGQSTAARKRAAEDYPRGQRAGDPAV